MSARPPDDDLWKVYKDLYLDDDDPDGPVFQKDKRLAREVAARFSRGNVSMQNSAIIDRDFIQRVQAEMNGPNREKFIRQILTFIEYIKKRK